MGLSIDLPPHRNRGDSGQVADYNDVVAILQQIADYLNIDIEDRIADLEARPIVYVQATAPASPRVGDGWIDL